MPALTPAQQRALRHRRQHERQAVVFGGLIAGMALAGLGATAIYTGALDVPFLQREFSSAPPETVDALPPPPCPTEEMLPVNHDTIQVRVYNASDRAGLASLTATELTARGFVLLETGNYPLTIATGAQIAFGEAGIAAAYTLAAHMENPDLLLDTRADATVDVVLGETFSRLVDPSLIVLDPTSPLLPVFGCVPLEQARITALPGPTSPPTPTATPEEGATEPEGATTDG